MAAKATPLPSATAAADGDALPALALAVELPWAPIYAGDPLRLVVRLSSPRAWEALYAQYLAAEAGQPAPEAATAAPAVPSDWEQGVALTLDRLDSGGAHQAVLTAAAWAPHLRQREADLPEIGLTVWMREWLVPAEAASLQEGEYALTATWHGQGPEGAVTAEEVRFSVTAPANDSEKAVQAGRLAYCAFARGDYAEARTQGQQALEMGVEDGTPERFELHFLVAGAAFGLQDYEAAIATYERIIALAPRGSDLALLAQQWIDITKEIQAAS